MYQFQTYYGMNQILNEKRGRPTDKIITDIQPRPFLSMEHITTETIASCMGHLSLLTHCIS